MFSLSPLPPTFDAALRDVQAAGERFRMAAAERLADPPAGREAEAEAGLRALAADAVGPVRAAAVSSLGRLESGADLAREALDDPHREVRAAAALALARAARAAALPDLRRSAGGPCGVTRAAVALALPETARGPGAGDAVALARSIATTDEEAGPRLAAVITLGTLSAAEASSDAARAGLGAALDDDDLDVRQEAALALAQLGDNRGASILRAALAHRATAFRAADALSRAPAPEAARDLLPLARSRWTPLLTKAAAGAALAALEDPAGEIALRDVLRALRSDGRSYAAERIGALGLTRLSAELDRLARRPRGVDPDTLERARAALATG